MDLYTISRTYPLLTFLVAVVLFVIGFKIAKKLFWVIAAVVLIAAIILLFV